MEKFSALMILLFLQQENVFFSLQIKWHLLILSTGRDTSMVCNLSIPQQNRCLYFHWIRSTLYESGSFTRWLVIRIKWIFQMYLPDSVSCMGGNVLSGDSSGKCVWCICFAYQSFGNHARIHTSLLKRILLNCFAIRLALLDLCNFVALELMTGC